MFRLFKILAFNLCLFGNPLYSFSQKNLTIRDIWYNNLFVPNGFDNAVFLSDNESIAQCKENKIIQIKAMTGDTVNILFDANNFKELRDKTITDFKIAANDCCILLSVDSKKTYRYSTISSWYSYSVRNKKLSPLIPDNSNIEIPSFSPTDNSIAFVKNNNLFLSIAGQQIQITTDGKKNTIINGRGDWVYEEEFEVTKAFEWNPQGTKIAWIRFDETDVPQYSLTSYDSIYPTTSTYKYPKAGFPPSKVSV